MGDGDQRPRPPRLPGGAPAGLREFVACRRMSVEIDTSDVSWLPMPPGVPGEAAPSVDLEPGDDGRSGKVKIGWGFISMEFPVRIVDGELVVDETADLPFGMGDEIDTWVRRLNDQLGANDKALDEFRVDGDKLTITKRAATPPPPPVAGTGGASTAPVATATTVPTAEEKPPEKRSGCLGWIIGGLVALAAAIGIGVVATNGGDDDAVSTPPVATDEAASSTTTTVAATTSTSTTVQVGLADEPVGETADAPACAAALTDELPVGEYITIDDPCDGATPMSYDTCTFGPLCATEYGSPLFGIAGRTSTLHRTSPPDAVTGEDGPSQQLHPFLLLAAAALAAVDDDAPPVAPDAAVLEVSADCGGTIVTGREPIAPGEPTVVAHPLFSYGPCTAGSVTVFDGDGNVVTRLPPSMLGDDGAWVVDATELPVESPSIDRFTVGDPRVTGTESWEGWTWSDDATTVRNVLAAAPVPNGCSWFFTPDNVDLVVEVLDSCSGGDHFWVFSAATTDVEVTLQVDDTTIGHAGSYLNPVGFESSVSDVDAFATSGSLFDQTLFPCGAGFVGVTACTDDAGPMDAGGFVTVSIAFAGEVPLEDDGVARAHVVDFAASGGGAYRTELGPDGWTVTGPDETRARSIIRGNSLTVVVPADELPEADLVYVLSTEVDGQVVEQPPVPVVGFGLVPEVPRESTPETTVPTTEPSTTEPPTSTAPSTSAPEGEDEVDAAAIVDFYAQLSAGLSSGDLTFPLERLHPLVLEAYPDQCPAALETFVDPDFAVEVVQVGETGPWTWELPDGRSYEVDEAITVTVQVSGRGQTGDPSDAHLATVDDELHWFTFCA